METGRILFLALLAIAFALFAWGCQRRLSLVLLGRRERRTDQPLRRLGDTLLYAFAQARVAKGPFGLNHVLLFWAFLVLLLANGDFILGGLLPGAGLSLLPPPVRHSLWLLFDLLSLVALGCAALAALRRLFFAPEWMSTPYVKARGWEGFLILSFVATLMLAFFTLNGALIALGREGGSAFTPVSSLVASLLAGLSPSALDLVAGAAWWVHAVVLLAFVAFLPWGKHLHILTAIPNCFFAPLSFANALPREEFRKDLPLGAGRADHLTWKDLFDGFACTECGRCQHACPAHATGKPLNPRQVVHAVKTNLLANGRALKAGAAPSLALVGAEGEGTVTPEALWSCTTCGACLAECPVLIEHLPKIVKMRRALVQMEADFPEELLNLFENLEQRGNPWGIAPAERAKWCAGLDIPAFEAGRTEYLFFVGCAGAFDTRSKAVTVALVRSLQAAGVSFGTLGREETCCGDSLRRLGNEYVFDRLARANAELFRARGVTRVITQCPHCFSTLANDFAQFGVELEVVHHSQLLARLAAEGRLPMASAGDGGAVAYHDPCYLGRHNRVYGPPREAILAATGREPVELSRHGEKAFCCGAGGGRMWMEEHLGRRINLDRVDEALASGASTLAVACPYCLTMLEDGLKDRGRADVRVRDIAEIVDEGVSRAR